LIPGSGHLDQTSVIPQLVSAAVSRTEGHYEELARFPSHESQRKLANQAGRVDLLVPDL
jgi:hypothetical protein